MLIVLHDIMTVQKLYVSVPSKDSITNHCFRQLTPSSTSLEVIFLGICDYPISCASIVCNMLLFVDIYMLPPGNPSCQLVVLHKIILFSLFLLYISPFFCMSTTNSLLSCKDFTWLVIHIRQYEPVTFW